MEISKQENRQDREFIRSKVIDYNAAKLPESIKGPVEEVSFITRNEEGEIIGGITGTAFWQHLHIDFLWVNPEMRGRQIGEKLISRMEEHALEKGYRLMVVDTFSFQAPGFYRKQGFREFGVIEDHPAGHSQHFFEKRLTEERL
ncbi:GNAT family N-acetyltransferase [Planococcus lenghuensis]|uniref:GNAT family N-acetyltransferase n=1 Tax=Planococcus lenghuensis TaxID=2213202 RepID=A0A1Q2KUQ2_9BACL|nr:GNAT family N-acetyltransferase [Planococcus lenghuensis]AQQ51873.1 GNAT family N-acetyltransferase [Planococcus lenghuensis]